MNNETIRGYRPLPERKVDRELSYNYLMLSGEASHALRELVLSDEKKRCEDDPAYTSDELMTDREAALACSGCPVLDLCRDYAEKSRPAWGTVGGKVYGRALKTAMEEE